jgi:hypothetical protein
VGVLLQGSPRRTDEAVVSGNICISTEQNQFVSNSAEANPGNIDYFSLEDEKLQELASDTLAVLRGCTISVIEDLNGREQDAGKYKSYLNRIETILGRKGVSFSN